MAASCAGVAEVDYVADIPDVQQQDSLLHGDWPWHYVGLRRNVGAYTQPLQDWKQLWHR